MRNYFGAGTVTRSLKTIGCVLLLASCVHTGRAFSLLGPFDTWQIQEITYQMGSDIGGPQNLGEEYRIPMPTLFYAFESSFLDYFGSNGVAEVEKAIKIINDLPAVSLLSQQLTEFQLEARRDNYQAAALSLLDLKSYTLNLLIEQMGLAEPERYTWTLRARFVLPAGCPVVNYSVIQRNFDPVTWEPTPYVNGVLYTYQIIEVCMGTPFLADAFEIQVDPLAISFNSVAGLNLPLGGFFTGLTRDDVGGLRYLYRKNNFNNEALPNNATIGGGGGVVPVAGGISSPWTPFFPTNFTAGTNVVGVPVAATNVLSVRGGIDKIIFRRVNFDSLLGSNFVAVADAYTATTLVNSRQTGQRITRQVLTPDFVFTARDLGVFNPPANAVTVARRLLSVQNTGPAGLNGPGIINTPITITYNKLGNVLINNGPAFIDEASSFRDFTWASFDGTTNAPVIYPSGRSIMDLEAQLLRP
ncbi:MAG: hypothetical protein DME26_15725 [Verrucomicrobia bacterium]|nr:MAG: hypothetical protein DME26_15725 [Verrucomicrobiota bacterium]